MGEAYWTGVRQMVGRLLIIALMLTHATVRDPRCICIADCGPGTRAVCCGGTAGSACPSTRNDCKPVPDRCDSTSACCDSGSVCGDSDSAGGPSAGARTPCSCCPPGALAPCDGCPADGCPPGCCVVRCTPCTPLQPNPVTPQPVITIGEFIDAPSWPVLPFHAAAERVLPLTGATERIASPPHNLRHAQLSIWLK